jgi:hypothetical protein
MARLLGSVWEMAGTVSSGNGGSGNNLGNAGNSQGVERKNNPADGVAKVGRLRKNKISTT